MRILIGSSSCLVFALIVGLIIALRQSAEPASGERMLARSVQPTPRAPVEMRAGSPAITPAVAHGAPPPAGAPSGPPSPTRARDRLLDHLHRSGHSAEPWMDRVGDVLATWRELAPQLATRVTAGPVDCYRDGCSVELSCADRAVFEQLNESLPATRTFLDFPGWRHRIGAVTRADGSVVSTWFFMRPDGPVANKE
jgi:hypothetical protein